MSCLVHGDSSGAGGSSCYGHGGHSSRLPPCRWNGGGRWGTLCGPLTPGHAQKKPQPPSQSRRASGSCGLSCPVCLALEFCHVMYCSVCLAPEGSWYPLTSPGKFFWGVERVPAVGAGPRGPRPRPQGPPAMASWAPCTAMASWAPSYAMASWAPCTAMAPSSAMVPVCLFRSGGPRPVFLSVFVLRGLQSAHPPSPMELLRLGTSLSGGGSYVRVLLCVMCSRLLCPYLACFLSSSDVIMS